MADRNGEDGRRHDGSALPMQAQRHGKQPAHCGVEPVKRAEPSGRPVPIFARRRPRWVFTVSAETPSTSATSGTPPTSTIANSTRNSLGVNLNALCDCLRRRRANRGPLYARKQLPPFVGLQM
jgi:hypothetical protein